VFWIWNILSYKLVAHSTLMLLMSVSPPYHFGVFFFFALARVQSACSARSIIDSWHPHIESFGNWGWNFYTFFNLNTFSFFPVIRIDVAFCFWSTLLTIFHTFSTSIPLFVLFMLRHMRPAVCFNAALQF